MKPFLLDVNVLIALVDPHHVHHDAAHAWFADRGRSAWATCPITENGFVRVLSQPNYPNRPGDAPAALTILRQWCATPEHRFWPDDVTLRDLVDSGTIFTSVHVTDVYLLGLAVRNGGRLATFDRRIPISTIHGAADALERIPV